MVVLTCNFSNWEFEAGLLTFKASLGYRVRLSLKTEKRTGDIAQLVEHLVSVHEDSDLFLTNS